jgi:phosphatidylinositol alpha-1,6-mannosyltransferase
VRTLLVTNDFPPRPGGIQVFAHAYASRLPEGSVVVYASRWPDATRFDAGQRFPVVRDPTPVLLPTPTVSRRVRAVARAEGCDRVWFAAAAPLGLLGPVLRRAGAERLVASTHGHEVGWARLPVARQLLRRIADGVDVVTYLGEYTRRRLAAALGPAADRLQPLPSGVDTAVFRPDADGAAIRRRYRLGDRPVVVCVSRLVARKGQDVLVRALPLVQRRVPGAALLLVGGGRHGAALRRLAGHHGLDGDVVFTGAVPAEELAAHYAAGDVFAMPCRTRLAGLEVEGLGIVYLEAAATGLPVVAGDSGGAPDAVLAGRTGYVVDGRAVADVADRVAGLLAQPDRARAMGFAGREWVQREWRWEVLANRLAAMLSGPDDRDPGRTTAAQPVPGAGTSRPSGGRPAPEPRG